MTQKLKKNGFSNPYQMIVYSFLGIITLGTLVFMLPISTVDHSLSLIDALFMSVSATCVTGLSVLDIGTGMTGFGQFVLLILIQLGGLGIMTFSTLFLYLLGKKTSMRSREVIGNTLSISSTKNIRALIKRIMLLVILFELMGTLLLSIFFMPEHSLYQSIYHGIFHSVSAFCNAGFSLYSNGFESYVANWPVNLTLMLLIIAGGLGFIVLIDLKHLYGRSQSQRHILSFHSKIVLWTAGGLLILGMVFIFLLELNSELLEQGVSSSFLSAAFQSVTARTAGFNTVPMDQLSNATLLVIMILMFVGAAPGSCGGGIKVTTFAILIILLVSRLKGQAVPHKFGRSISTETITKVSVIALVGILIVVFGFMGLLVTEHGLQETQQGHGPFEQLLFETISAYGTVGLSLGITSGLSFEGKIIIILLMFVGRLGPLTVAVALSKSKDQGRYRFANGDIMVG